MASGRLGVANLAATTNTSVYTVPASTITSCNVSICNRNAGSITIRLAIGDTGTPGTDEYLEYNTTIEGYGVLERTGIVMDAAKVLVAYSNTANVSAVVTGFEDTA